jgi:hypothetical protein
MKSDSKELRTLRAICWERAKGELMAMLNTYWEDERSYEKIKIKIKVFIEDTEMNGLQE